MKTFQQAYYLEDSRLWPRAKRNLRLFAYLLQVFWLWFWIGGKVRRRVRRARAKAEPYWIDHLGRESR